MFFLLCSQTYSISVLCSHQGLDLRTAGIHKNSNINGKFPFVFVSGKTTKEEMTVGVRTVVEIFYILSHMPLTGNSRIPSSNKYFRNSIYCKYKQCFKFLVTTLRESIFPILENMTNAVLFGNTSRTNWRNLIKIVRSTFNANNIM
jgi:hypothetical protein